MHKLQICTFLNQIIQPQSILQSNSKRASDKQNPPELYLDIKLAFPLNKNLRNAERSDKDALYLVQSAPQRGRIALNTLIDSYMNIDSRSPSLGQRVPMEPVSQSGATDP